MSATIFLASGCLFTGAETQGLPCNADDECAKGLSCIERICGGPSFESNAADTHDEDATEGVDETSWDEDEPPALCTMNRCQGANTLRTCQDGKLSTRGCQGHCGEKANSLGCHYSEQQGEDSCFCDFARSDCSTPGAQACASQSSLVYCTEGSWWPYDCDAVCVDAGYGGAAGCGPGDAGVEVCLCSNTCTPGAQRCTGNDSVAYCQGGGWQQYGCNQLCKDSGLAKSLGCIHWPDDGDGCVCL